MRRSEFIKQLVIAAGATTINMKLAEAHKILSGLTPSEKMPALFVGHGNPMNAIEDNEFSRGWKHMARDIRPQAILCISAHWETRGTFVTGNLQPRTIHDFGGFPQRLFDVKYPAPGSPELAKSIQKIVTSAHVGITEEWGLDHGTWSVLINMFPEAKVPVLQLSLDRNLSPEKMYELAAELQALRSRGVLIVGSGNIVHNLMVAKFREADPEPYDWAEEFDHKVTTLIEQRDHSALIQYEKLGEAARMSIPTAEHYLPMLYTLALQEKEEEVHFFNESIAFGSGSMRSFIIH